MVYVLIYKVRAPRSIDAEESSLQKEMLSGSLVTYTVIITEVNSVFLAFFFFFLALWCYVSSTHTHVRLSNYFIPQLRLGLSFVVVVIVVTVVICLFALLLA